MNINRFWEYKKKKTKLKGIEQINIYICIYIVYVCECVRVCVCVDP